MILVCNQIQKRLDAVWYDLQTLFFEQGISQIDLDERCVEWLESVVIETLKRQVDKFDPEGEEGDKWLKCLMKAVHRESLRLRQDQ